MIKRLHKGVLFVTDVKTSQVVIITMRCQYSTLSSDVIYSVLLSINSIKQFYYEFDDSVRLELGKYKTTCVSVVMIAILGLVYIVEYEQGGINCPRRRSMNLIIIVP